MLVSRHHELEITESEIEGAMDLYGLSEEEAVQFLISDPSDEIKKRLQETYPRLENSDPKRADRIIRTAILVRCRVRGRVLGKDHIL